jgi:hypothetical protein
MKIGKKKGTSRREKEGISKGKGVGGEYNQNILSICMKMP